MFDCVVIGAGVVGGVLVGFSIILGAMILMKVPVKNPKSNLSRMSEG